MVFHFSFGIELLPTYFTPVLLFMLTFYAFAVRLLVHVVSVSFHSQPTKLARHGLFIFFNRFWVQHASYPFVGVPEFFAFQHFAAVTAWPLVICVSFFDVLSEEKLKQKYLWTLTALPYFAIVRPFV